MNLDDKVRDSLNLDRFPLHVSLVLCFGAFSGGGVRGITM